MLQSYIIYVGTAVVSCMLAYMAASTNKRKYIWWIIAVFTLVAGLRSENVGLDTESYLQKFELIAGGQMEFAYGLEFSFRIICYVLSLISDNSTFFLMTFALLTNLLIVLRFWDFRHISSFPWMILCYNLLLYHMTMNGLRQFCAVAIVFYATRYLHKKKILPFLIGVAIAFLFHQTAFIGLVFLVERLFQWGDLKRKQKVFFIACLAVIPVAMVYIMPIVSHYEKFFSSVSMQLGIMVPAKILLFLFAALFVWQYYRRMKSVQPQTTGDNVAAVDTIPGICIFYFLGLLLTGIGYFFTHMERIGWYFYLYEGVYFGMLRRDRNIYTRYFFAAFNLALLLYGFLNSTMDNAQGTIPYEFFWQ